MLNSRRNGRRRERGFVLYMYAFMTLFIIIPIIGLAIDAGIAYAVKSKLQTACDGAALGAARSLSRGLDLTSQQASATDTATRYFHANFPTNWMGVASVPDPTVTWPTPPLGAAIVNVQADITVPTWFMKILGVNSLHIISVGQATRRNVNVMMVIDRSQSLDNSGSCPALATDSAWFATQFQNNRDRMGLLTFGTYYHVDFALNYDFQTSLTTMLPNLVCSGWTNSAAAMWTGYQKLKALGDLNALNVILFFTDGQPNTVTFGNVTYGGANTLPKKSGSSCNATSGPFSGVIGGGADGIFKDNVTTWPAPEEDRVIIGSSYGNNGGCYFSGGIGRTASNDVAYLPDADAFGNSLRTSLLGGSGFPASVTTSSGHITVTSDNVTNAGVNALDNAAQRMRVDAASLNMPFVIYSIGLGNAGGVNNELLKRVANDPNAGMHQTAYSDGIYVYSPDTAHLSAAFATIASDILRLSK